MRIIDRHGVLPFIAACLTFLFCLVSSAHAETNPPFLRGFTLNVGMGGTKPYLYVRGPDETITLTGGTRFTWFLKAASPAGYLWDSPMVRIGYDFLAGVKAGFCIDSQEVDGQEVDLGASSAGWTTYLTPVLFLETGEKEAWRGKGFAGRLGLGVGVGYLHLAARALPHDATSSGSPTDFEINSFSWNIGYTCELRWRQWVLEVSGLVQEVKEGDYTYDFRPLTLEVGYTFF